ncbi:MAG: nitroreductase family protein [Nanoarchaeota archaeon]|nr:nitroreductase family protein [Nanoarchaeota archaeon]
MPKGSEIRKADYPIDKLFLDRWSPRAMSGESISEEELMTLFEAARWAPSTYNEQEWRFIYAKRGSADWDRLFNLLMEANQVWCGNAAVLACAVSKKTFTKNNKANPVHTFDCGSAWENLALQASIMGLVAHGMAGFDYEKAKIELNIPDDYKVEMMFVVGRHGKKEDLPENLQEMEYPSDRKKVSEFIFEGKFRI